MEDRYELALIDLMKKKQAEFKPPKGRVSRENVARNVVCLMDALKRSIKEKEFAGVKTTSKKKWARGMRRRIIVECLNCGQCAAISEDRLAGYGLKRDISLVVVTRCCFALSAGAGP